MFPANRTTIQVAKQQGSDAAMRDDGYISSFNGGCQCLIYSRYDAALRIYRPLPSPHAFFRASKEQVGHSLKFCSR